MIRAPALMACGRRATREIKRVCPGCKISGGVSNIAFGFRGNDAVRRAFHSAFLHHACAVRRCTAKAPPPPYPQV